MLDDTFLELESRNSVTVNAAGVVGDSTGVDPASVIREYPFLLRNVDLDVDAGFPGPDAFSVTDDATRADLDAATCASLTTFVDAVSPEALDVERPLPAVAAGVAAIPPDNLIVSLPESLRASTLPGASSHQSRPFWWAAITRAAST